MHLKILLIVKSLNQIVESQLSTSLWNGYHQRLSDIKLIQITAIFSFLSQD